MLSKNMEREVLFGRLDNDPMNTEEEAKRVEKMLNEELDSYVQKYKDRNEPKPYEKAYEKAIIELAAPWLD